MLFNKGQAADIFRKVYFSEKSYIKRFPRRLYRNALLNVMGTIQEYRVTPMSSCI